jgi:flagellum-specific ATP synthase
VLSRSLAEAGHYPAIDIEASISRVMPAIVDSAHMRRVHRFKQVLSRYQRNRDLIAVGAYTAGNDPQIDEAVERYPWLESYLQQGMDSRIDYASSAGELADVLGDKVARHG